MKNLFGGLVAMGVGLAVAACGGGTAPEAIRESASAMTGCVVGYDWSAALGATIPGGCEPTSMSVSLVTTTTFGHQYVQISTHFDCEGVPPVVTRTYTVGQQTNQEVDPTPGWDIDEAPQLQTEDPAVMYAILQRRMDLIAENQQRTIGNGGTAAAVAGNFLDLANGHIDIRPCAVASKKFVDDVNMINNTTGAGNGAPPSGGCQTDADCAFMCTSDSCGECWGPFGETPSCHEHSRGIFGTCSPSGNAACEAVR